MAGVQAWLGADGFGVCMRVCRGGGPDQLVRWADLRMRHIIVEDCFAEVVRGIVQRLPKKDRVFIKREGDFLIEEPFPASSV